MTAPAPVKRVAIYCGARSGKDPVYKNATVELGTLLGKNEIDMVYGGGSIGLMGVIADAVLATGREVIGVIPYFLEKVEFVHPRLTRTHIVNSMHARKALMEQLCDAFIVLPGGFGTLDELFDVMTLAQLNIHQKHAVLLNTGGYWNALLQQLKTGEEAGFIQGETLSRLEIAETPLAVLDALLRSGLPSVRK